MYPLLAPLDQQFLAEEFIRKGVVCINTERPFSFRNGWRSPIKLDFKTALESRELVRLIMREVSRQAPTFIRSVYTCRAGEVAFVGVPSGGCKWAEYFAGQFNARLYRSHKNAEAPLGFTVDLPPGWRHVCVAVEDVVTEGGSTIALTRAIPSCVARAAIALFSYNFPSTQRNLEPWRIQLAALVQWGALFQALTHAYAVKVLKDVECWHDDPVAWTKRLGFVEASA